MKDVLITIAENGFVVTYEHPRVRQESDGLFTEPKTEVHICKNIREVGKVLAKLFPTEVA